MDVYESLVGDVRILLTLMVPKGSIIPVLEASIYHVLILLYCRTRYVGGQTIYNIDVRGRRQRRAYNGLMHTNTQKQVRLDLAVKTQTQSHSMTLQFFCTTRLNIFNNKDILSITTTALNNFQNNNGSNTTGDLIIFKPSLKKNH